MSNPPPRLALPNQSPLSRRTIARLLHNSIFKSRDKLVSDLQRSNPSIINTVTQAHSEVSSIGKKKSIPNGGGFVW